MQASIVEGVGNMIAAIQPGKVMATAEQVGQASRQSEMPADGMDVAMTGVQLARGSHASGAIEVAKVGQNRK
jgi:hypothetical protein